MGNGFSSRFRSSWRGSESGGRNVKEWIKFSCLWWMKALILRVPAMCRRALELQWTGRPRIVLSILRKCDTRKEEQVDSMPYTNRGLWQDEDSQNELQCIQAKISTPCLHCNAQKCGGELMWTRSGGYQDDVGSLSLVLSLRIHTISVIDGGGLWNSWTLLSPKQLTLEH